uniref:Uncharacterized protein n=1 Tax=Arundo donax TaxID=35708 RepID=A0A0A8YVW7_ARUDO
MKLKTIWSFSDRFRPFSPLYTITPVTKFNRKPMSSIKQANTQGI